MFTFYIVVAGQRLTSREQFPTAVEAGERLIAHITISCENGFECAGGVIKVA